jgi:hypothetical protein
MPFAKGLLLIGIFSVAWGLVAGINAILLRVVAGIPLTVFSAIPVLVLGLLETLALVAIIDHFSQSRLRSPSPDKSQDRAKNPNQEGEGELKEKQVIPDRS